jgi:hypothetical protein
VFRRHDQDKRLVVATDGGAQLVQLAEEFAVRRRTDYDIGQVDRRLPQGKRVLVRADDSAFELSKLSLEGRAKRRRLSNQ